MRSCPVACVRRAVGCPRRATRVERARATRVPPSEARPAGWVKRHEWRACELFVHFNHCWQCTFCQNSAPVTTPRPNEVSRGRWRAEPDGQTWGIGLGAKRPRSASKRTSRRGDVGGVVAEARARSRRSRRGGRTRGVTSRVRRGAKATRMTSVTRRGYRRGESGEDEPERMFGEVSWAGPE
jgi:hypothetical protein